MLPREHRLSTKQDITSALRRGRRHGSPNLVVHIAPSATDHPARAAFAVSSAVGNSVVRHRITRQLRATTLPLLQRLPAGTDLVVRALPAAREASFAALAADLTRCLRDDLLPEPESTSTQPETPTPAQPQAHVPPRTGISQALFILASPLRLLLIALVTIYRKVISPVLPPTCRYHPSCSAYALQSLQVHGVVKGVALSAWRLGRCNPFSKGGLDPVPPRGAWRPDIHPDGTPRHPEHAAHAVGLPDNPGTRLAACTPQP